MDIKENKLHITRRELSDERLKRRTEVAASQVLRSASVELLDLAYDHSSLEIALRHKLVEISEPEVAGGWVVPD